MGINVHLGPGSVCPSVRCVVLMRCCVHDQVCATLFPPRPAMSIKTTFTPRLHCFTRAGGTRNVCQGYMLPVAVVGWFLWFPPFFFMTKGFFFRIRDLHLFPQWRYAFLPGLHSHDLTGTVPLLVDGQSTYRPLRAVREGFPCGHSVSQQSTLPTPVSKGFPAQAARGTPPPPRQGPPGAGWCHLAKTF